MIVFTMDIGELIGICITGILVVFLVCLYVYDRIECFIEKRKSRK